MSYKSAIRGIGSIVRQVERESIRRQKELERQRKEYEKMQELERASYEVELYENYIERMTTIHKDCGPKYDWENIFKTKPPIKPINNKTEENKDRNKLEAYKASFFDKLFKTEAKKRSNLEKKIQQAIETDEKELQEKLEKYNTEMNEYNEIQEISKNIIEGNLEYYKKVIEDTLPFEELKDFGSNIKIQYISKNKLKVLMNVLDEKAIPKQSKSLLKSGKLSTKDIPKGKYYELYQDYICSSVLRIGREIFALLPIEEIIVTAKGNVLNLATGRIEEQPLLSVLLIKETMEIINFDLIDPSDSMSNFKHNMSFKKTQGMAPVEELL